MMMYNQYAILNKIENSRQMSEPPLLFMYERACDLAKKHLSETPLVQERQWNDDDLEKVQLFLLELASSSHHKLSYNYIVHVLSTSIMAGLVVEELSKSETTPSLDPIEARALGLLHDLGALIGDPSIYLRKDLVQHRFFTKLGWRDDVLSKLPNIPGILGVLGQSVDALKHTSPLQRVLDAVDNLSKFKPNTQQLFSHHEIVRYMYEQPRRYSDTGWPSQRRGLNALNIGRKDFSIQLFEEEVAWLEQQGVDLEAVRQQVQVEFQKPENAQFIESFQDKQESSDYDAENESEHLPNLTTVVFDVGNVLISSDDNYLIGCVARYLTCDASVIEKYFDEYNTEAMSGRMLEEDYLKGLYAAAGVEYPSTLDDARKAFEHPNVYNIIDGMPELLAQLRANNPTLEVTFFSDIIPSLVPLVSKKLAEYKNVFPLYSCQELVSKREGRAHQWMVDKLSIDPKKVLFIDDNISYVDAAAHLGSRRHYFHEGQSRDASTRLGQLLINLGLKLGLTQ
jgi:FMN phosphatase YigB (HAD superfamily)